MNARHQQIPLHRLDRYLLRVDSRETPMHTASLNVYRLPQGDPDFVLHLFQRLKTYAVTAGPFSFRVDRRHRGRGWDVLDTDEELATLVGIVGAYGALPHFERIAPFGTRWPNSRRSSDDTDIPADRRGAHGSRAAV